MMYMEARISLALMSFFCRHFNWSVLVAYAKRETQSVTVTVSIRYNQVNSLDRQLCSYSNKEIFIFLENKRKHYK